MKYALVGHPVSHSLSKLIHNAHFSAQSMKATYDLIDLPPSQLAAIRTYKIDGYNVTVPYKEKIISQLDDMDIESTRIGAVNTVVCRDGFHIGHNTDSRAFMQSLPKKTMKNALVIGAGGVARSIIFGLTQDGIGVDVYNRTPQRAAVLASEFPCNPTNHPYVDKYDLIVNATSVGQYSNEYPLSLEGLRAGTVVYDVIYAHTPFLREAKQRHGIAINGLDMLVRQAGLAFEIWTGRKADLSVMKRALE